MYWYPYEGAHRRFGEPFASHLGELYCKAYSATAEAKMVALREKVAEYQ